MGSAEFRSILKLLNESGETFQVPPYQRGYEWQQNQWKDLWLDLNRIEQQGGEHFLGNVILLHKKDDDTFEIVDGQQRITTISILLMAIRDSDNWSGSGKDARIQDIIDYRVTEEFKRRLYLNDTDIDETYERIWNGETVESENEIYDAYRYYTNKLKSLEHSEIDDLLDEITESLKVVRTKLEDPALAYPIFQSQNARGKEVPQHILATSRVYGGAYKLDNEREKERVIRKWDDIYDSL